MRTLLELVGRPQALRPWRRHPGGAMMAVDTGGKFNSLGLGQRPVSRDDPAPRD